MKAITPVIAITVLILMTIAAAALAYLTVTQFQNQANEGAQGSVETLSVRTSTQLKVESVSEGKIYLRNLGGYNLTGMNFFIHGVPLQVSGPEACDPGALCVFSIQEAVDCQEGCTLSMGADMPLGSQVALTVEQLSRILTTFSDGSSSKTLSFTGPSSGEANITLPIRTSVSAATLEVSGAKSWSQSAAVAQTTEETGMPDISVDSSGIPHLVWAGEASPTNTEIYYMNWTGGQWSSPYNVSVNTGSSGAPQLAFDSMGRLHLVWQDDTPGLGSDDILYTNSTGGAWSSVHNISGNSGRSVLPQLAFDPSGDLHVIWWDDTPNPTVYDVFYANQTSAGWSGTFNVSDNAGNSYDPRLAFDSSGILHVVWWDDTVNFEVYYKNRTDGIWSGIVNLSQNLGASYYPDIAFDSLDTLHLVWRDTELGNPDIFYKNRTGGVWSSDVMISATAVEALYPRIGIDTSDAVHVIWQDDSTGAYEILYRNQTQGVWSDIVNLSQTTDPSSDPQFALGPWGMLHAVWKECAGASCTIDYKALSVPYSPSLLAGSAGPVDWSYPSYLGTSSTTSDFSDKLTALLADCTCTSCWSNGTHCTIGLNLTTQSAGIIELSGLNIVYS